MSVQAVTSHRMLPLVRARDKEHEYNASTSCIPNKENSVSSSFNKILSPFFWYLVQKIGSDRPQLETYVIAYVDGK